MTMTDDSDETTDTDDDWARVDHFDRMDRVNE